MSRGNLPVVAVIPAYNAESTLVPLLHDVLEQNYDQVVVLDDASTDNTYELALSFLPEIKLVKGHENAGSAGNRNRVIPLLGRRSLIHFLDADLRLNSERTPEIISYLADRPSLGFLAGLIRDPDGRQNPYNYGPDWSVRGTYSWAAQWAVHRMGGKHFEKAAKIRGQYPNLFYGHPNTFEKPQPAEVGWATEGNMVVPSEVYAELGGYDPSLRYFEILELAARLKKHSLKKLFDPAIDTTHFHEDYFRKKLAAEAVVSMGRAIVKSSLISLRPPGVV